MASAITGRSDFYRALAWLLWASGASSASRRHFAGRGRFVLMLHGIAAVTVPGIPFEARPHLTSNDLKRILEWLTVRFDLLNPSEFLAGERPGVLLTFDDGLANNYTNALPVLRSFGVSALFFVSTQHVVEPRNWLGFIRAQASLGWKDGSEVPDQVAADWYDGLSVDELKRCSTDPLVTIGSHGVTHAILTQSSDDELEMELSESRRFLESVVGETVDQFAYPRGGYDARVLEAVRRAGYSTAYAMDPVGAGDPALEVPRVGIYRSGSEYLSLKMSGLHRRPLPLRVRAD